MEFVVVENGNMWFFNRKKQKKKGDYLAVVSWVSRVRCLAKRAGDRRCVIE